MEQLNAMKLLQTVRVQDLKAPGRTQVTAIQKYIKIRMWSYTSYPTVTTQAIEAGTKHITRILLNKDAQVVGTHDTPVAVLYVHNNQVAAYVLVSRVAQRLVQMHEDTVNRLPTSKIGA